jgi:hypothetical protein
MTQYTKPFPTFPEFKPLTLSDKQYYENFISDFPTTIQYSFHSLFVWWGIVEKCMVSELNGNLVVSFWIPGLDEQSGLGIIGNRKIDETLCEIFDYQKDEGREPKVVHVPDFVIKEINFPDIFSFTSEPYADEPILRLKKFTEVKKLATPRRQALRRLFIALDEGAIDVTEINLGDQFHQRLLKDAVERWEPAGRLNSYALHEKKCLIKSIEENVDVDMRCVGLYVKGKLHSFLLFHFVSSEDVNLGYLRLSYEYPHIVELAIYQYASWMASQGGQFVNLDADAGIEPLRTLKLSLGADKVQRFFTVTPSKLRAKL